MMPEVEQILIESTPALVAAVGSQETAAPQIESTAAQQQEAPQQEAPQQRSAPRPSSTAGNESVKGAPTIMLIQMSKHESTRTYWDYPSTTEAVEAALVMYETRLKEQNMGSHVVSYDLQTLFSFVDDLVSLRSLPFSEMVRPMPTHS